MDRREFLATKSKKAKLKFEPPLIFRTNSGLNEYAGPWTVNEVTHLLKRTMFGAKKTDINYFLGKTMAASVDELLNPTAPMPAGPVKDYDPSAAATPDTGILPGQVWVNDPNNDGTVNSLRRNSFRRWWTGRMINQDRSIREKMILFWHNHFPTEANDVGNSQFVYKYHALLRNNVLGNFKSLVRAVTVDPAMLRYLNGYLNTASAPDENYSRELQELFAVGKENNPNYTEDDVKAAAKVLTGWQVDANNITSYFNINRHDKTNKTFSSFYNGTIITGVADATAGDKELDALLTMIFNKKAEVSKFIVKKLYRWFVYYEIDAATETNVILPLAQILQDNNWEIKPVLSALLKSEHFYDAINRGCIIKSPVDFVISICREYNLVFADEVTDYITAYAQWNYIFGWMVLTAQAPGDPPNVSGWAAYYQEPQFYELWINSDTLPKRNQFSDLMIGNGFTRNGKKVAIDPITFADALSNPGDPNILITDSLNILYKIDITQASKDTIKKQILLSGQDQDYYWTNAWLLYKANPNDTVAKNTVLTRLQLLYKYFMNLAEYQLS
jgi:uncharacterized protein (DUF1800 family)